MEDCHDVTVIRMNDSLHCATPNEKHPDGTVALSEQQAIFVNCYFASMEYQCFEQAWLVGECRDVRQAGKA
jgi:hypothetical protein